MKKIVFLCILSFLIFDIQALNYGGCDYSTVSRMKSIIKNINISYDYDIIENEANFHITINNLTDDIYFEDSVSGKNYYYKDTIDGEITFYNYKVNSGNFSFYSNKKECYGLSLGKKYYSLPSYNKFFSHALCSDIHDYKLCKKWGYFNYSEDEFIKLVSEYKEKNVIEEHQKEEFVYQKTLFDKIAEFYINNYYYLLGGVIIICVTLIFINNRKNRFKL